MQHIVEPQKNIDVIHEAEVVVVGGGPAGIGAALAAARNGAETIIIERFNSLGGLQTQGLNPIFSFVDPELHSGILPELLGRLKEHGALKNMEEFELDERARLKAKLLERVGSDKLPKRLVETEAGYWGCWGRIFDLEYYKYMLDNMMQEAGVKVFFNAPAVAAIREGDLLKGVTIEGNEGRKAILGKVIIDTSGEGNIVRRSGAPVLGDVGIPAGPRKGDKGLGLLSAFFIGGVDRTRFQAYKQKNIEEWNELYVGQKVLQEARNAGYYILDRVDKIIVSEAHDVYNSGKVWVMTLLYKPDKDTTEELSKGEMEMRRQAHSLQKILKDYVPGFENSFVDRTAHIPLKGGGYSLMGEHVITVGEMREGKAFEDSVAISNMPPDLYELAGRFGYEILPHDVPYRSLVSKEIGNLMAAGTTISSGMFAGAALRYCTPSICTGYASGTGAALAVKNKITPKKVNVKMLQDTLRQAGAKVSVNDVPKESLEPYKFIQKLGIVFRRTDEELIPEDEIAKH